MEVDRIKVAQRYANEFRKDNPSLDILNILYNAMFRNMDREKKIKRLIPTVPISKKNYNKCFKND